MCVLAVNQSGVIRFFRLSSNGCDLTEEDFIIKDDLTERTIVNDLAALLESPGPTSDVCLVSKQGDQIHAHLCFLVTRLEYFKVSFLFPFFFFEF